MKIQSLLTSHSSLFLQRTVIPFIKLFNFTTQVKPISQFNLSLILATKRIQAYCENGLLDKAQRLFDEIPERDVIVWTATIDGYTSTGYHYQAWTVFYNMIKEVKKPNAFTFSIVIKACKGMKSSFHGSLVHGLALKHGLVDGFIYVENALIDLYGTYSNDIEDARIIFDQISVKSAVSWTTMIACYTHKGDGFVAIDLFRMMLQDAVSLNPFSCSIAVRASASIGTLDLGKQIHLVTIKWGLQTNIPVANALVDMYCRLMNLSDAKQFFYEMPFKDIITWNTLIAGFLRFDPHVSLELFFQMMSNEIEPNYFTFTSIAVACAKLAAFNCGKQVHSRIIQRGFGGNLHLDNALISMYAKCGNITDACKVFDEMNDRNLVSWTSMIMCYAHNGHGKEAVQLFEHIIRLGFYPDKISFMAVLTACSHSGLIDEGLKYFTSMIAQYGIFPDAEICGCVVDLLGRAGRLMEAYNLIKSMPFEPDESVWGALLGASKVHRNKELGSFAAERILSLKPEDADAYVILSNIYAANGDWNEFAKSRKYLRRSGSRKESGKSWIEVGNEVHSFSVFETMNSNMDLVWKELDVLMIHMTESGYLPDPDFLYLDF